jgi:mitochondrial fission protein ELM1
MLLIEANESKWMLSDKLSSRKPTFLTALSHHINKILVFTAQLQHQEIGFLI